MLNYIMGMGEQTEKKVVFYRSILSEIPMICVFCCLSLIAWRLTLDYPGSVRFENIFDLFVVPVPLFALPPFVLLAFILHRVGDNRYEIWEDHVRAVTGILSLEKDDTRIEYVNIRGIEIKRNFYGRIFNIGDVIIVSSAISGVEVVIDNVRDPSKYRDIILKEMHEAGVYPSGHHEKHSEVRASAS